MPILRFCVDLFFQVVDSLDARGFIFGAFIIITITRFLLLPLIGGGAIDAGSSFAEYTSKEKREERATKRENRAKSGKVKE